ncbi:uncharacterized protein LOC106178656 [Lingula anatina]|uniref:Uncharacterized protein LOC106178656 n=1 Tax=Lingula anatina TaxID=7574 RepID=A0A1S3K437_LINAN|nr:uncharacterized protein LOC106178656 [Lingula anatina]XP_013417398.1 uncharacterized protein LOC106178656 [Lingula anatina]XP_013417415.1 uncharacterized protein LOC106178656 [Lingula anatina]|eukprot:XP_013417390.1 uncharacterized protein LOC106178656 [Lingula anatina]
MFTVAISLIIPLAIFVGVITGAASQVRNTSCAGRYISPAGECVRYRTCSSEGQYIREAGNETQDNKCFCDGSNRFAPQEPKKCFEENNPNSCLCLQCPPETLLNITENGVFVEKFDLKEHCVTLKEERILPSDDCAGWKIAFGVVLVLAVITIGILSNFLRKCRQEKGINQTKEMPLQESTQTDEESEKVGSPTSEELLKEDKYIDMKAHKADSNTEKQTFQEHHDAEIQDLKQHHDAEIQDLKRHKLAVPVSCDGSDEENAPS